MLSLYKIWTVAKYEMKTLLRSWFFRIFALIAIAVLTFTNVPFFALKGNTPWVFRGISASIPYYNILILNVIQAIIAVFLASDFLKRDKKLDTTEVVYMRSMNNSDYVLGKLLGILLVFLGLNLVVLMIAAVFNIFFSDVPLVFLPYLLYPIFISIPTLIFIFGLSFLSMVTIRNQAVTFILLLGYIAVTIFFLGNKFHYLFDYITFNVPLMYSDFVGFGNLALLLLHRGMYLLLGLSFVFATILLIKRLPQSVFMTRLSWILMISFLGGAIALGANYISHFTEGKKLRATITELNKTAITMPKVTLQDCRLHVQHRGRTIQVTAQLKVINKNRDPISRYQFSLNPGLVIKRVSSGSSELKFERNAHLLFVVPRQQLQVDGLDSLTIVYDGTIDEQACYIDIDEKKRAELYRAWLYNIAKRFSFIEPDHVLLTPEANWYPIAGLPYAASYPKLTERDFTNFQLTVATKKGLTVIAPGKMTSLGDSNYRFDAEQPLPQLCLAIGNYEKRSIQVDSVEYSLFNLKGHDYYSPFFKDIGDTLIALIREMKQDYENKLGLNYPYPRLALVETPIQFFSYARSWTDARENVQPSIIFLPEKGVLLERADFSQMARWQKRRLERSNQTLTPQELQSELFRDFVSGSLLGTMGRGFMAEIIKGMVNCTIFPNYYSLVNNFSSGQWPIFNVALESFLLQKTTEGSPPFRRFFAGLSDEEKANLALMEQTLPEILADVKKKELTPAVLKAKGNYLFKLIESQLGKEQLQSFLSDLLTNQRFKNIDVADFIVRLKNQFNFDLEPHFNEWYQQRQLPGFIIADVEAYKVLDKDRTRYQIKFKASNPEPVAGLLSISFRTGGFRGPGFGFGRPPMEPTQERLVFMRPNETKELGVVLDEPPRMMMINTLISKNLPATINRPFDELELKEKAEPFDGERLLSEPIRLVLPNETIVDNEDSGFQLLYNPSENWLKRLLKIEKTEDKYVGMNFWQPPSRWRATTMAEFYGEYIHSALYIKAGDGNKKVAWKAFIPTGGNYEVFYYNGKIRAPWFRRMGERQQSRRDQFIEQFNFKVYHDDGVEDVTLDLSNAEEGWISLGTFYLSSDTARVELTDRSKGRIVIADAVKWLKL
ncbi:MAG: hypothetical protein ONB31_08355 [candidate division KSB1 bacterium]|nr:hypothetical protein [candidate division KSB1 bacterium]MDZ7334077.1 hypothetical protein [candidate division KSB1 bacterium]MDZ7357082.1 hypothetical protein [candidate division KSB1 bacterium]MDZ7399565.1 hypothetical protein [candidate division KSB1 bacterium]